MDGDFKKKSLSLSQPINFFYLIKKMKSKNPWYINSRGGFQGSFKPNRPPYPTATDSETGRPLKPLNAEETMKKSEEKERRRQQESSGYKTAKPI